MVHRRRLSCSSSNSLSNICKCRIRRKPAGRTCSLVRVLRSVAPAVVGYRRLRSTSVDGPCLNIPGVEDIRDRLAMAKDHLECWAPLADLRHLNPPSRVAISERCLRDKLRMHRCHDPGIVAWDQRRISSCHRVTRNSRSLAKPERLQRQAKVTRGRHPDRNRSIPCGEPIDLPGGSG